MFLAATFLYTKSPPIHPTKVAAKKNIFLATSIHDRTEQDKLNNEFDKDNALALNAASSELVL